LPREFLLNFSVAMLVCLVFFRMALRVVIAAMRHRGLNHCRVILVGANDRTAHLFDVLARSRDHGYEVIGIIETDAERMAEMEGRDVAYLGPVEALEDKVAKGDVDEVLIGLPVRSNYETIQHVAHLCQGSNLRVRMIADLFSLRTATSRLMYVEDIPVLSLSTIPEVRWKLAVKRALDIVVSTVLLLVLAPVLFLPVAILIKLESKGPVFFAQERVGQNGRRFRMLKFRSMVQNAEELKARLAAQNEADGPVFKMREDPRITRIGKYLRKYSLDEFPQLINVFLGQMSLVGPRPPIFSEVVQYSWDQRRRLSVKPGMTGLWQVSGRSDVGFSEWVELDLAYIDNWSLWEDFVILLKTFRAVVEGRGAA